MLWKTSTASSNTETDSVPIVEFEGGQGVDPNQLVNTYVHPKIIESGYIVGSQHGVRTPIRHVWLLVELG